MDRIAFVEVLDRRGRVRERVRLHGFPATIGRGYESDVIVEDRYVSPKHCRIVRDETSGDIIVEDLGSVNGVSRAGFSDSLSRLSLASGARFRIGETTLRYVESGHPVAPAEPLVRGSKGVVEALRRPGLAVAAVVLAVAVLVLDAATSSYGESDVLGDVLVGLAALAAWAGVWAFVNRLLAHRFEFRRHLAWAGLLTVGFVALASLVDYVRFLFSADSLATVLDVLGNAAGFGMLLVGHLAIIPAATPRLRKRLALASAMAVAGIVAAFLYTDEDLVGDLPFRMPLKSFGAEWAPADTTEELLQRARRTKSEVDALRE